jgi:hypothetical protein
MERDKREREAWERQMRDIRELEFMEKMKQEMDLKLPGMFFFICGIFILIMRSVAFLVCMVWIKTDRRFSHLLCVLGLCCKMIT